MEDLARSRAEASSQWRPSDDGDELDAKCRMMIMNNNDEDEDEDEDEDDTNDISWRCVRILR